MEGHSVVRGKDQYGRRFVSFSVLLEENRRQSQPSPSPKHQGTEQNLGRVIKKKTFTIFQRKTYEPFFWTGSNFVDGIFHILGRVNSNQLLFLYLLVSGNKIILDERFGPREELLGYSVCLSGNL